MDDDGSQLLANQIQLEAQELEEIEKEDCIYFKDWERVDYDI